MIRRGFVLAILGWTAVWGLEAPLPAVMPGKIDFPALKFTPPPVQKRFLSSGATVYLLPDHELPLVNVTAFIRTGSMVEPPDQAGLAALCGTLLRAGGTETMAPEAMNEELEFLGASVETSIDTEMGTASLSVLKKDLDRGLAIFADVLRHPAFRKKNLEIEKAKLVETIRRRNDDPFQIARRSLRKALYGPTHPLSRTVEIPIVKKVRRADLVHFYELYFAPNNLRIAVSGDFDPEAMMRKLEEAFGNWPRRPGSWPPVEEAKGAPAGSPRFVGLAQKDIVQATVLLGRLGVRRHDPDHFALEVLNEIFGGSSFSSRLYKEVRSRQGLAYWVGSSFSEFWDRGPLAAGCQTKNASVGQTLASILEEMDRIRKDPVSPEELKLAQDSIINSFVFRYASAHAIVTQKMTLDYFGYAPDYLETYPQKIAQVSIEDVREAARKYFDPALFSIVVVGDKQKLDGSLDRWGAVVPLDLSIPEK